MQYHDYFSKFFREIKGIFEFEYLKGNSYSNKFISDFLNSTNEETF